MAKKRKTTNSIGRTCVFCASDAEFWVRNIDNGDDSDRNANEAVCWWCHRTLQGMTHNAFRTAFMEPPAEVISARAAVRAAERIVRGR